MITFEYYDKDVFWFKRDSFFFPVDKKDISSFSKKEEDKKFLKWIRIQEKRNIKPSTSTKRLNGRPCSFENYIDGKMIYINLSGEKIEVLPNRTLFKIEDLEI